MSGILGISLADRERLPIFRNTAVTKLLWDGTVFRVVYMNDASHLPDDEQGSWSTAKDLRDEPFDPVQDRAYYEDCYADAWRAAHGSLCGYSPDPYYQAAVRHHRLRPGAVLRMYHGDEPVGLVDLDPERGAEQGAGWISLLYLKEEYRGKGYGIQALARPIFFFKALGRTSLRLQVAEKNAMALSFYRREGFRVIGEENGHDGMLFLMERPLEDARHG
jgi:ribosomal protein S18 acetylase RimI-like enzyme